MFCTSCPPTIWATSVEIAQNCRRTKCTEHVSMEIRPSKRLELYIFQTIGGVWNGHFPESHQFFRGRNWLENACNSAERSMPNMTGQPGCQTMEMHMNEVRRRTLFAPRSPPCFVLFWIGVETEGLLDYQGREGIISIAQWNLRPGIFGVAKSDSHQISGSEF